MDLGRAPSHLDLQLGTSRVGGELSCAGYLGEGLSVVAQKQEIASQVSGHPREARTVAGLLRELPSGLEVFEDAVILTEKIETVPEVEANVDPFFEAHRGWRQVGEGHEGALEARDRLVDGGPGHGLGAGFAQACDRLPPGLASEGMSARRSMYSARRSG